MITSINTEAVMRTCRKCGEEKPLDAFEVVNKERGWRRHQCKACKRQYHQEWAERSREHIRQKRREYHEANREQIIDRVNKWVKENPQKRRKNYLAYYYRLQDAAIRAYGGYKCKWCGIDEPLVLTLDHINNDGAEHRKELGTLGGAPFYRWLKENDYPDGFQVLCMNCNHAKHRNGGVLPDTLKGRCNDYPERE